MSSQKEKIVPIQHQQYVLVCHHAEASLVLFQPVYQQNNDGAAKNGISAADKSGHLGVLKYFDELRLIINPNSDLHVDNSSD